MSKFQTILLVVFGFFILLAVGVFALYRGTSSGSALVVIWGDIPDHDFSTFINSAGLNDDDTIDIRYEEKSSETIDIEFTESLARGEGPDLVITSQEKFWKDKPKLSPIPYSSLSERDFKMIFIEEGELFLSPEGIYALPFSIDPMVLYYNRDLLSASGQAKPITYWDELYAASTNLSKKDAAGNIVTSVMALGEARNIPHAKEILSLLMLQAGSKVTSLVNGELREDISINHGVPVLPAESALSFYTQFSNPTKVFYSWNRSLLDAQTHFASGDSAYYLGFASEFSAIKNKNPILNFAVTLVPQSRVSGKTITYGNLRGVAISRGTKNPLAAFMVATKLVSRDASLKLSETLLLPPPRRDLLSSKPTDSIFSVFYDATLQSKGWLDPDFAATRGIFQETIESVTSGRSRTSEALSEMGREIDKLIEN